MSLRSTVLSSLALVAAFAAGITAVKVAERRGDFAEPAAAVGPADLGQARRAGGAPAGALPDFSAVAEIAIKGSVNISSTQNVAVSAPMYELMYGRQLVQPSTSLGSGVFVSEDGYVLTNSHVVQDRNADIKVTMPDNRELTAKVVGIDPYTDLAVLKTTATGVTPIPWGDSSTLRAAEWVLAVGNPFEFNQTVTLGIVSSPNRHDPDLAAYNDFIQTDAAINPGNSGGALVNGRGELVGINTMIASNTGGYQGIGFAIPSNLARQVMADLIKNGEVVRGSIGNLMVQTNNAALASRFRLGTQSGVVVRNMSRSDSAYMNGRGILPGDVIVRFNGTEITEQSQLRRLIAAAKIGSTATVDVIRGGEKRTFQIPIVRQAYGR
ncbi:MAG TPA: trypsin-like peptidase domain-containing protein [Vicinamibacterales bacterium]|nr:trypsin-like peptidase domain-containing protein [Vicinamibacterales bacterium]